MQRPFNVLFLCTGNSARSIIAEALLNSGSRDRFRAYSAGSHPVGKVNPFALDLLYKNRLPAQMLRSKSWVEFAQPDAPELDFVFTVCDNAAGEMCPAWPGQPMTAHWGISDPSAVAGDAACRRAFFRAFRELHNRLSIFTSLPIEKLDRLALQGRLDDIGRPFPEAGGGLQAAQGRSGADNQAPTISPRRSWLDAKSIGDTVPMMSRMISEDSPHSYTRRRSER